MSSAARNLDARRVFVGKRREGGRVDCSGLCDRLVVTRLCRRKVYHQLVLKFTSICELSKGPWALGPLGCGFGLWAPQQRLSLLGIPPPPKAYMLPPTRRQGAPSELDHAQAPHIKEAVSFCVFSDRPSENERQQHATYCFAHAGLPELRYQSQVPAEMHLMREGAMRTTFKKRQCIIQGYGPVALGRQALRDIGNPKIWALERMRGDFYHTCMMHANKVLVRVVSAVACMGVGAGGRVGACMGA